MRALSVWARVFIGFACTPALGATTLTFQQGVNGYSGTVDTFLKESLADTTQGDLTVVEWDGDDPPRSGQANYALIRFDEIVGPSADQIPAGSQVTTATLTYTVRNGGNAAGLHEARIDWDALTTYNTFGPSPGVQAEDLGVLITPVPGTIATHTVDVTESLVAWVGDPAANHGWIIVPAGPDGVEFHSSEYATVPTLRPKLTVTINGGEPSLTLIRHSYLQQGTPTTMTIAWRTNSISTTRVSFGTDPRNLTNTKIDAAPVLDHFVTLDGLNPGTRYYYDVGSATESLAGGDEDHYFTTPPTVGTRVSFTSWIVGDSGTGGRAQADVRDAMLAATSETPPDIFIHVGDMAYTTGTDIQFTDNFFMPYSRVLAHTVTWPTIGNHEGVSSDSGAQSGPYYDSYFLPKGGEAGGIPSGTEAYYSFDYANAHFVCLDSHDTDRAPGSAMLTWLAEDLAATDQEWLIAFWHHPTYTKGTHDSDNPADSGGRMRDMRENVLPILEAGGVDLVLAGHSHIYERSFLVDGAYDTPTTAQGHIIDADTGFPGSGAYTKPAGLEANQGTVYVVAGHGGASVAGAGNHPLMFFSEVANGSCLLTIDANILTLKNIRSDGVETDSVQVIKIGGTGDLDNDGHVDNDDYSIFAACMAGPGVSKPPPGCSQTDFERADMQFDNDVDLGDYGTYLSAFAAR